MIKSEQCLSEKGQLCQGSRCPGNEAELSNMTLLSNSCMPDPLSFASASFFTEK